MTLRGAVRAYVAAIVVALFSADIILEDKVDPSTRILLLFGFGIAGVIGAFAAKE